MNQWPSLLLALLLSASLLPHPAQAQCQSGNCQNGHGTYDWGFAVYEGEFRNGQMHGQGRLRYDDYTYEGQFADGAEHGSGIITWQKDGRREAVIYKQGVRQADLNPKVAAADYHAYHETQDSRCLSGNCLTGTGTFRFESGNQYAGQFVNSQRQGAGTFAYANGDRYEGQWVQNNMQGQGSFRYAATGFVFTGEFRANEPFDGTYRAPDGRTVQLRQGQLIRPPQPAPTYSASQRPGSGPTCPECRGAGRYTTSEPTYTSQSWHLPDTPGQSKYLTPSGTHQVLSFQNKEHTCPRCHGSGHLSQ